jgi:acyl-CoA thioesterase
MTNDERAWQVASHMRAQEGAHVSKGLTLEAAREGYALVSLAVDSSMLNSHGSVHGGVIFTLADTAFAYACNSRNQAAVAQQVSIVFVSPGQAGERLAAEAAAPACTRSPCAPLQAASSPSSRACPAISTPLCFRSHN